MSRVNTYLNFQGQTEEAFNFYATVFGTKLISPIARFGDMPANPGTPAFLPDELKQVMHVELPILAGHVLMGTDILASMGHELRVGNNTTISLEFDSREETDRVFAALSEDSTDKFDMQDMPWGAYWGVCLDRFSIRWMFSYTDPEHQPH
jgi:PhnB protein